MTEIRITIDSEPTLAIIRDLTEELSDASLSSFLALDGVDILRERASIRFANEGDDAVGAWRALRPATNTIRAWLGFPPAHPINKRTGDLEKAITTAGGTVATTGSGSVLSWPEGVDESVMEKFRTAQQGKIQPGSGKIPFATTPKRPVVGISEVDGELIAAALTLQIMNRF